MVSWLDVYNVFSATVPLYVSMILGYLSTKHLNLFSLEQCVGINKFIAKFSIPLLSFQVISQNNPFTMSLRLILSDILQKILAAVVLAVVIRFWHPTGGRGGKLGWIITGLSVTVFPNTLIIGIPILSAIDGDAAKNILVQIVVLQCLIWSNILLFLFEINATWDLQSSGASIEHRVNDNEETDIEQEPIEEEEAIVRTRSSGTGKILVKAWRKFIVNPNTYAAMIGLIWATLHFRLGWKLPEMIDKSIHLISDGGLGMAMFSLGLFMASQSSIIACGTKMSIITMILKFILGPALMIASAFCIRLRGTLFRVTILQVNNLNFPPQKTIMVKGPGLYTEIGKKARDLLYKDYQGDQKLSVTTYSSTGVAITTTGTNKGDLFVGDVTTQVKNKNFTADIKVATDSSLLTTFTYDEATPGLKAIVSAKVPDQKSGKVELQYLHDYAGICTSVGLTASPIVNFSGVVGNNVLALGTDVSFNTQSGDFKHFNAGFSFTKDDLIAALTLNDKGDKLNASYYHIVNPLSNTVVGAEVTHSFTTQKNAITVGAQHALDPLTTLKARVNNDGVANALIQHQWRPKSFITVSGEVNSRAIEKGAKVGFALALKP
ncbi:unnamed protein product [Brassica rapa]|uniref:Auxin efflux carrier component n=1 Tax=Brassica campestris TaxID=3711 RepID=A0A3P5ZYT6_BRACM|nr:unnamed protein product [Brassica rapa]VDC85352.1 unnamed protein product [Brassica rapa]